jgi:Copper type II ascorbate-dependent monooxygenase, C-terminal domain
MHPSHLPPLLGSGSHPCRPRRTRDLVLALALPFGLLLVGPGCGDNEGGGDSLLEPPAAGTGFQVSLKTRIAAGEEHEYCKFVQVPEAWAVRDEVRFSAGSHHVLLYQTPYLSIPTRKDTGEVVDTSGVFDCTDGATNGWSVTNVFAGSQNRNGDSMLRFPDGVAAKVGGVVLINAHYINASDQELEPEAYINVYTVKRSEVQVEGGLLFLYNPFIYVPSKGSSRARWSCPVHGDMKIANLQSHMHARGVGYQAELVTGTARTMLYETNAWESVPTRQFGDGLAAPAGSRIDYYCDYRNSEGRMVVQGPSANDEMCMLIGSYYPADARTSDCLDASGEQVGGDWIGDGTRTCAQTIDCVSGATSEGQLSQCLYASKAEVSQVMSAAMRCFLSSANPEVDCAVEFDACGAL